MTVRLDLGGLTDSHLSCIFRFFKLLPMIITKKEAQENPSQKFNIFWERNYSGTHSFPHSCTSVRQSRTQEKHWPRTLGPFNVPIQSEAIIEVSEWDFDSETSKMAFDWIGLFKGPNVCTQRFSCIWLCLVTRLFALCLFMREKTSGFQGKKESQTPKTQTMN